MKKALIIFVRNPVLGQVKTRLAATVGDARALEIYNQLLEHTRNIAAATTADKFIFYVEQVTAQDMWSGEGFYKMLQTPGDLGHKMKAAFDTVFMMGFGQVVIIGSDCLQLTTPVIEMAFYELQKVDAVIGPAIDGGYYLLGLKRACNAVFEKKEWSTATVFVDSIADFQRLGLSFKVLPTLTDVDTESDWISSQTPA